MDGTQHRLGKVRYLGTYLTLPYLPYMNRCLKALVPGNINVQVRRKWSGSDLIEASLSLVWET